MKTSVKINISPAELLDKIVILELKAEHITNRCYLKNIHYELNHLKHHALSFECPPRLLSSLKDCNEKIWHAEDTVREKEKNKEFDEVFIEAARTVYCENDRRGQLKKEINLFFDSEYIEEKSHALDYHE